jgi:hypothetical protein
VLQLRRAYQFIFRVVCEPSVGTFNKHKKIGTAALTIAIINIRTCRNNLEETKQDPAWQFILRTVTTLHETERLQCCVVTSHTRKFFLQAAAILK